MADRSRGGRDRLTLAAVLPLWFLVALGLSASGLLALRPLAAAGCAGRRDPGPDHMSPKRTPSLTLVLGSASIRR
jgi:hypothetical protein